MKVWNDDVLRSLKPIRLGQNRGDDVRDIKSASNQKDDFHLPVRPSHHQNPDQNCGNGNGNVPADVKHLHGSGHAGELGDDVRQINKETRDHHEERRTEAELLTNQVGKPLARDNAHPCAHLLGHIEGDGHGYERPQQSVAVLRARLGIRRDAARIVVDIRSDQPRADDCEQQSQPAAQSTNLVLQIRAARPQPFKPGCQRFPVHPQRPVRCYFFTSRETTSSTVTVPMGRLSSSTTVSIRRLYLSNSSKTSFSSASAEDRKSTRLNSSHPSISYAVFCLKKKKKK